MKNNFKTVLLLTIFVGLFSSCNKDEIIETNEVTKKSIVNKQILDESLIERFSEFQQSKLNLKSNLTFDTNTIYEVSLDEKSPKMLVANQHGFDDNNRVNYGLGVGLTDKGDFTKLFIVKTNRISDDLFQFDYYDTDFNLISSVEINSETQAINFSKNLSDQNKGCGQATADCLADVYSNHGWVSVWATVQSAFLPQTALALAAACAASECL